MQFCNGLASAILTAYGRAAYHSDPIVVEILSLAGCSQCHRLAALDIVSDFNLITQLLLRCRHGLCTDAVSFDL